MILLYAGRRSGGDTFPAENVDFVREQVEQLLEGLRPRVVVGSAAAGADLIVLAAALGAGATAHVHIAGPRTEFRTGSVVDKGAAWGRSFDALLDQPGVTTTEIPLEPDPDESYRAVTSSLRSKAAELQGEGEEIIVLAISARRQGTDHTEELVEAERAAGRLVLRIDPARTREQKRAQGRA
jgi:hypothetical protein